MIHPLSRESGIKNPTMVRVDKEGQRLVVINRDGVEIRNYMIKLDGDGMNEDNSVSICFLCVI